MTNKWVAELQYISSWYGFTPDSEMRERNISLRRPLERLGPEWLQADDSLIDSTAVDPDLIGSPEEEAFLNASQNFPAIDRMLYNAGVTSVLVEGTIKDETDYRNSHYNAVGRYQRIFNTATTSALTEVMSSEETIESVSRHELGHAFSYNVSPFTPIQISMYAELSVLNRQRDEIDETVLGPLSQLATGFRPGGDRSLVNFLARKLKEHPELREYMPVTTSMLEDIDYFANNENDPEDLQLRLSEHDYIVDAYQKDLLAIINGEGPEGARFEVREIDHRGIVSDRACIVIEQNGVERVIDIDHYVPGEFEGNFIGGEKTGEDALSSSREEAFAEIFEEVTGIMSDSDLAYYFPNMANEVREIIGATEILDARETSLLQSLERDVSRTSSSLSRAIP